MQLEHCLVVVAPVRPQQQVAVACTYFHGVGWVAERGEEVWAQLADGSCRWRQTSSEITLLCLTVPDGTPAKQLRVTLDPYFIRGDLQGLPLGPSLDASLLDNTMAQHVVRCRPHLLLASAAGSQINLQYLHV